MKIWNCNWKELWIWLSYQSNERFILSIQIHFISTTTLIYRQSNYQRLYDGSIRFRLQQKRSRNLLDWHGKLSRCSLWYLGIPSIEFNSFQASKNSVFLADILPVDGPHLNYAIKHYLQAQVFLGHLPDLGQLMQNCTSFLSRWLSLFLFLWWE